MDFNLPILLQNILGSAVQKLTTFFKNIIFEPSLVSAASTDGRGIKAHDVCIKTGQDARF